MHAVFYGENVFCSSFGSAVTLTACMFRFLFKQFDLIVHWILALLSYFRRMLFIAFFGIEHSINWQYLPIAPPSHLVDVISDHF